VTFDTDLDRETDVSRFSISFFSAPTPHPLSQGYRLITQQTLWQPFHDPISQTGMSGQSSTHAANAFRA